MTAAEYITSELAAQGKQRGLEKTLRRPGGKKEYVRPCVALTAGEVVKACDEALAKCPPDKPDQKLLDLKKGCAEIAGIAEEREAYIAVADAFYILDALALAPKT